MSAALLSPRARNDLLEAVRWIAKDNRVAARGLREAVVLAARRIGEHPQIGVLRPELADDPVRFLPLTGYPYLIVYDSADIPPLILRVLHGARDLPGLFGAGGNG
jgi:toxin ParE1/3/4